MEYLFSVAKNNRVRGVILNATVLLLFAAAWVSDEWPQLTIPSLLAAFVVIGGEAAVLYLLATKVRSEAGAKTQSQEIVNTHVHHDHVAISQSTGIVDEYRELEASSERDLVLFLNRHHHAMLKRRRMAYAPRPRASQASTWALAALNDDRSQFFAVIKSQDGWTAGEIEARRALNSELAKWKAFPDGSEAFRIEAGAFMIEYFHGRTNIRVLDSTKVTVEGSTRGSKLKTSPLSSDFCAPVYQ
ncbi:hypothetical protein [Methylocapsa sp. S129]|uniref:hypothetical protein n=1 Tax=Methylocapsa sp. S129 TaxID=1641869 RepID=UPI00131C311E|nr:hypothetical protein [Methylocapsa sp. S129]